MVTMNISLPAKLKAFVEERVATGAYSIASDFVRDLIRKKAEDDAYNDYVRKAIAEADTENAESVDLEQLRVDLRSRAVRVAA